MKIARWLAVAVLLGPGVAASAQEPAPGQGTDARIWLDRGDEPLLQRGDRVRVYYRTDADAFVAVFHVDTDGTVTLLHPRAPEEESYTRGGRDYRLLFPQSSYWYVDEYPGKGYFFLVASPEPLALAGVDYAYQERRWDLSRVGQTVYRDPYLAMDDYVALLIPDWENVPYALDFLAYDVGEVHEYPRFLCYDCHGFRSYATWNPYTYACASFRVVVWDDPWFYPGLRYQATRVVYAPPRRGVVRFEFKERAPGEAWTPLVRTREAAPRRSVQYVEPGGARPGAARPDATRPDAARPGAPRSGASRPEAARPGSPSTAVPRRPSLSPAPSAPPRSGTTPSRQAPAGAVTPRRAAPSDAVTPPSSGDRPVLQRRPSAAAPSRPPEGGTRAIVPPRAGASTPKPSAGSRSAPSVRPPASGARPPSSARPSTGSRPTGSSGRASPPPPRRKPGGGDA